MATKKTTTKKAAATKTSGSAKSTKAAPAKKAPAKKPVAKREKKLSAIDAAAKVLLQAKEPLNTKQMIEAMEARKLWTSPGGKTPHATLYSAIIREIGTKGKASRFKKTERGKFALNK